MAYPQPQGSEAVANVEDQFRLNTLIVSPGDIYELNVSTKGIALGPLSDISQVRVSYYDPSVEVSRVNSAVVSPDRSFISRINSIENPYPTSGGKKGRILFTLEDRWDPTWVPLGGGDFRIQRIVPRLDLIAYFKDPPSLIPPRSDGMWRWEYVQAPLLAAGPSFIVVPYYGRKYAAVDITNWMVGVTMAVTCIGLNYTTNPATVEETTLWTVAAAAAAGGKVTKIVRASVDGMYDALVFKYQPSAGSVIGPIPTRITTSDDAL